jgi:hypothetical protein
MPALSYKPVGFELRELKAAADGWEFSGYASTFGNVDVGGDVVLPGAFTASLKSRPKPKLFWQHDSHEPLGVVTALREDDRGLFGEWKISKTTRGQDAYQLLKDGAIDSMSIGYIPTDSEFKDDGVRELKSVDLLEVSLVSIPMNTEALVTSVKAQLSEMPFGAACKRLAAFLEHGVAEAKALHTRRASDKRELSDLHISAIDEVLEQAEAWVTELKALRERTAPPEANLPAEASAVSKDGADTLSVTQIRLRMLRKNLERRGLLEIASA